MTKNPQIVRLTTGEELLCYAEETYDGFYHLTDVSILVPTQEKSLAVMPYLPYSNSNKEGIYVRTSCVMFIVNAQKELADHHREIHSSIVLPKGGIQPHGNL